ncbi:hypothetical protein H5410_042681 [Solanum commersonii]|uniref:Uncharacterized protein n=1 Tax=Solanum commersonii TaxID=4109 RepID=A0A9J5XX25_SOLCO|nr:hypothetical protein H5410_042681 [Solanum commersonii]
MAFLDFFTDITLVTILKAVSLYRDLQERILWKIIDGMVMDIIADYMIEQELYERFYCSERKVKDEFNYSASYSLSEVHNRLSSKQTMIIRDTSFDDLKGEIEHLKEGIEFLKQNHIICDHRLTQIESANSKGKNKVDDSTVEENIPANTLNIDLKQKFF